MLYKHRIREEFPKIYSQDLINNLFRHPYTKIDFVRNELNVSKPTAIAYLNQLCECQNPFLQKIKIGRENYYVNTQLFNLLQNAFQARQHWTRKWSFLYQQLLIGKKNAKSLPIKWYWTRKWRKRLQVKSRLFYSKFTRVYSKFTRKQKFLR